MGGVSQFIVDDSTGKITGYKTKVGADTVFPFNKTLRHTTRVIWDMTSTANDTNLKDLSYTCPESGILGYSVQSSNDLGSAAICFLNGVVVEESYQKINNLCGLVQVNPGDVVRLYAYGVKGDTSNASAYVCGVFAPY